MNTMMVPCMAPSWLKNSGSMRPPGAVASLNSLPISGIGSPGNAICQRISSISENPVSRKTSAVIAYWIPITLWSCEKT